MIPVAGRSDGIIAQAGGAHDDRLAQLRQLGELLSAGVLTQAEFEQQKAKILSG